MLYLGIDQHARQITISLRDDNGDVVQARQVSTEPKKINAFFQQLTRERLRKGEPFVAVLEVCGFNDWLIRMLRDYTLFQERSDTVGHPDAGSCLGVRCAGREDRSGKGFDANLRNEARAGLDLATSGDVTQNALVLGFTREQMLLPRTI